MQRGRKNVATRTLRAGVGGTALLLLGGPGVGSTAASAPPDEIVVSGLVRDFHESHPDFELLPELGHVAGNVAVALGAEGTPTFVPA